VHRHAPEYSRKNIGAAQQYKKLKPTASRICHKQSGQERANHQKYSRVSQGFGAGQVSEKFARPHYKLPCNTDKRIEKTLRLEFKCCRLLLIVHSVPSAR
jgi:hypothetical protein